MVEPVALEIVIRGGPGVGKTTVAAIIYEALKARGVIAECYVGKREKRRQYVPILACDVQYKVPRLAIIEEQGTRIPRYPQPEN